VDEQLTLDEVVRNDTIITSESAYAGIARRPGEIVKPLENINIMLGNQERLKYELKASRIRQNLSSRSNLLGEFPKIEEEYPGFIISAEMVSSKFCILFSAPEMTQFNLHFRRYPIMTDVTFKAIEKGYYLCSSVIYNPDVEKNVTFFQAIIKYQNSEPFCIYFKKMFKKFALTPENFLGVLMDFSQAQRNGFIDAFISTFGSDKETAMSYLKSCFMHWMQSVQRVKNNHALVPACHAEEFLRLVYKLRTCTSTPVF
jgi:hypothetical protein